MKKQISNAEQLEAEATDMPQSQLIEEYVHLRQREEELEYNVHMLSEGCNFRDRTLSMLTRGFVACLKDCDKDLDEHKAEAEKSGISSNVALYYNAFAVKGLINGIMDVLSEKVPNKMELLEETHKIAKSVLNKDVE